VNCAKEYDILRHGKPWTVTSNDEGEGAVIGFSSKMKPSHLAVLSTHTDPIKGLHELLARLAALDTGDIRVLPLHSFWRPLGWPDEDIGTIINDFGCVFC
jgi:hypothetical protein